MVNPRVTIKKKYSDIVKSSLKKLKGYIRIYSMQKNTVKEKQTGTKDKKHRNK